MIDYHIHPDYSIDADPFTMESYCQKAQQMGLKEICFTTHCEFDQLRKHLDWYVRCGGETVPMHPARWVDRYFADISACATAYASSGLIVKTGLEAGYDLGLEGEIEKLLVQYPFDFVIGSVHCLDHIAISAMNESSAYFAGKKLRQVAAAYYKTLQEAVSTGLFDVIGHFDIYRRHGHKFFGDEIKKIYEEYIGDVLDLMLKNGTGLEINTSSLRHGQGPFYPSEEILSAAVKSGIKNFTVGSDCHRVSELGQGVGTAIAAANRYGIRLSVYEKRKPKLLSNL